MRRRTVVGLVVVLVVVAVGTAVAWSRGNGDRAAGVAGWGPAPRELDGLRVLATADTDGLRLHTGDGDRTFLPGINLGGSLPGRLAGDFSSLDGEEFGGWIAQMRQLGIRVVRVHDLMPPAFYDALHHYNSEHATDPLYLVHGVRVPDTSYADGTSTLYDERVTRPFAAQVLDAVAAVHGDLAYAATDGQTPPVWTSDVSPWVVAWILGQDWDPGVVERTDGTGSPEEGGGTYVAATRDATPTERWLAGHLDALAGALAERGTSVPLSFVNWPTTDPLAHPDEPLPREDAVGIDAEHVQPTDRWPGGVFATMHAYPYYPDFLRHEEDLRQTTYDGAPDPYAGYLARLREHHASMPLVVAETGVPSSLGSAHLGPRDRDQGGLDEREAMAVAADLLRLAQEQGTAGAFLSSWTDDWSAPTWNTAPVRPPDGRHRWHDPLTASQWFGVLRHESGFVPDSLTTVGSPRGRLARVTVQGDGAYLRVLARGRGDVPERLTIDVDTVGDSGPERRVVVEPARGTARALVRAAHDPLRLVAGEPVLVPDALEQWHLVRLLVNGARVVDGTRLPAETVDVGTLVHGSWEPGHPDHDSRATWRVSEADRSVRLRLPWSMLGVVDPSAHVALGRTDRPRFETVDGLGLRVRAPGSDLRLAYRWPAWGSLPVTTRLVEGHEELASAYRELAP